MFELYITNRHLCKGDFIERISHLASLKPHGIVLREKDMSEGEYADLARRSIAACDSFGVPCILHSFVGVAVGRISAVPCVLVCAAGALTPPLALKPTE